MRTKSDKAPAVKDVKAAMAQAKVATFTTSEILLKLDTLRTAFVHLATSQLEAGKLAYVEFCLSRVRDITELFEKIENGRAQADIEVAQTVWAAPVVLMDADGLDFEHMLKQAAGDV